MKNSFYNVCDYGAVGDGVVDDTAAILATLITCHSAGGGTVYFPAGIYLLSHLEIPTNTTLLGAGRFATTLRAMDPSGDLLFINSPGINVRDLGFDCSVARTSGSYINFAKDRAYECIVNNFRMEKAFIGITLSGPAALYVEHGSIRDISTSPGSCGILVNGGNDHFIRCVEMDNDAMHQPLAGIYVQDTGCINITDCDIIHCGNDLLITGGWSIYCINTFFDTAICGVRILAQTPVGRSHFIGCWTSSHTEHGFLIEPNSSSTVEDMEIIGHQSFFNGFDGIFLGKGSHIKVEGSSSRHNGMNGIHLAGSDYVIVTGNDTTENKQAGIVGTAPHSIVANNF